MVDGAAQENNGTPYILEALYNCWLSYDRSVVENPFEILKKLFKELLQKTNLHILSLPNVVISCCMLHNLILNGIDKNVEFFTIQLEVKN
jgi:hypothetical protein